MTYTVLVLLGQDQLQDALDDLTTDDTIVAITQKLDQYTLVYSTTT